MPNTNIGKPLESAFWLLVFLITASVVLIIRHFI